MLKFVQLSSERSQLPEGVLDLSVRWDTWLKAARAGTAPRCCARPGPACPPGRTPAFALRPGGQHPPRSAPPLPLTGPAAYRARGGGAVLPTPRPPPRRSAVGATGRQVRGAAAAGGRSSGPPDPPWRGPTPASGPEAGRAWWEGAEVPGEPRRAAPRGSAPPSGGGGPGRAPAGGRSGRRPSAAGGPGGAAPRASGSAPAAAASLSAAGGAAALRGSPRERVPLVAGMGEEKRGAAGARPVPSTERYRACPRAGAGVTERQQPPGRGPLPLAPRDARFRRPPRWQEDPRGGPPGGRSPFRC